MKIWTSGITYERTKEEKPEASSLSGEEEYLKNTQPPWHQLSNASSHLLPQLGTKPKRGRSRPPKNKKLTKMNKNEQNKALEKVNKNNQVVSRAVRAYKEETQVPLRLVFRRESVSSNYEVRKSSLLVRPKREAAKKVSYKYVVDEDAFNEHGEPLAKMPKETNKRFKKSDLVKISVEQKMNIFLRQPSVSLNHSDPFPIALVEEHTSMIYSKGLLFNHLYVSFDSQCILCPLCKCFLSVTQFSRHLHDDIDNDLASIVDNFEKLMRLNGILKNKMFNILPYRIHNDQNAFENMFIWKDFGRKYANFKLNSKENTNKTQISFSNPSSPSRHDNVSEWDFLNESKSIDLLDEFSLNNFIERSRTSEERTQEQNRENDLKFSENEESPHVESNLIPCKTERIQFSSFINKRYSCLNENSQANLLLYICENHLTIVPLSFVDYLNSKRMKIQEMLKSEQSLGLRKIYLSKILNLEINFPSDATANLGIIPM